MNLRSHSRLLIFALVPWLIALAVPDIRNQFRLQSDGWMNPLSFYGDWNVHEDSPWYRLRPRPIERIVAEHPGDVRVAFLAAEIKGDAEQRELSAALAQQDKPFPRLQLHFRVYEPLIRRFPHEKWLVAAAIRHSLSGFKDDRVGGTIEDSNNPPLAVPPTKSKEPPSFTPLELRQCIALTRNARAAEPQNAFYDWWLAYYLLAGYRDSEALQVLHEGAQKTHYDDHVLEEMAARVYVHGLQRISTAESKANVIGSQNMPHSAVMYHAARLLAWHCHEEKAKGRHSQALQITIDVTRIAGLIRDQASTGLDSSVAAGLSRDMWDGVIRRFSTMEKNRFQDLPNRTDLETQLRGSLVAAYARHNGDNRAATLLLRETHAYIQYRVERAAARARQDYVMGLRLSLEQPAITLWLGTQIILCQSAVFAALCVLLLGVAWPLGMEKVPSASRDANLTATACCLLFPLALAGMYYGGAGWLDIFGERAFCGFLIGNSDWGNLSALLYFFAPVVLPFLVACAVTRWRRPRVARVGRIAAFANAISRLPGQLRDLRALQMSPERESRNPVQISGKNFAHITFTVSRAMLFIATPVTVGLLILSDWQPFYIYSTHIQDGDLWSLLLVEAMLWCVIWLITCPWWRAFKIRRNEIFAVIRWYRSTTFTYLLLTGWLYLALSAMNLGFRRQSSAEVDAFLQRGEAATMLASRE